MIDQALLSHLATGATHVCHCWSIARGDGVTFGFTDHDRELNFDGIRFQPESGLSAKAIANTTGLAVDNTEAVGILSSDAINEADISAGRYDGAGVSIWLVQWDNVDARQVQFVGTIGDITRASGGFQAELRGLSDALNQPQGRSYLKSCSAILGDECCGVDLTDPVFSAVASVATSVDSQDIKMIDLTQYNSGWFEGGVLEVLSGDASGLRGVIRTDHLDGDVRQLNLWEPIRAQIFAGDEVRLTAGCNRLPGTCREKFANLVNFRGFPTIPGDDWLVSVPKSDGLNDGGSRFFS